MSTQSQIKRDITKDIKNIEEILSSQNATMNDLKNIHIKIDGKYQSKIKNWGQSMYNWSDTNGFDYTLCSHDSLQENLLTMKYKLEGYLQGFDITQINIPSKSINYYNVNSNHNENINTNTNNQIINFNQIEEQIKELESLTPKETDEAIEKLKELEKIYNSKNSRKNKWEAAKKILVWVADKSVDLAITYFPIIMQILNNH